MSDDSSYPRELDCLKFSNDPSNPGNDSLCSDGYGGYSLINSGTCASNGYLNISTASGNYFGTCEDASGFFPDKSLLVLALSIFKVEL